MRYTAVPNSMFVAWANEVASMDRKMQKRWKHLLVDKHGSKTRVIFRDGVFLNYSVSAKCYVPVGPIEIFTESDLNSDLKVVPASHVGRRILLGDDHRQVMHEAIVANHTGKHYRNHYVRVPVSGGGQVLA